MGFQRRPGPLLTGLSVGLLLLFSWMTLAQPTSLSGTALFSAQPAVQYPTLLARYRLLWGACVEEGSLPF